MRARRAIASLLATVLASSAGLVRAEDSGRAIENVLISRQGAEAIVRIKPRCPMRYLIHSPPKGGSEVRIRLSLGGECRDHFDPGLAEDYDPGANNLADVESLRFAVNNRWMGSLSLTFAEPYEFSVRDSGGGWLEVRLNVGREAVELADQRPLPLPSDPPTPVAGAGPGARGGELVNRAPSTRKTWESVTEQFVVQLGIFADLDAALRVATQLELSQPLYAGTLEVNGRTWHELMTGPYSDEAAADAVRRRLADVAPDAWVRALDVLPPALTPGSQPPTEQPVAVQPVQVDPTRSASAAAIDDNMTAARAALIAGDNAEAIERYTAVLETGGHAERATAREYLGVALERSGRRAEALAEYRAWLAESDGSDRDRQRVQARLDGLATADAKPSGEIAFGARDARSDGHWDWLGGVAQYYRRDVAQVVDDRESRLALSALYNFGDLMIVRDGERFVLEARASGTYVHDTEAPDGEEAGEGWVSEAYLSLEDAELGIAASAGRQSRFDHGVLGRFDGLDLRYRWRPDISFSVVTGLPLDSVRYIANRERFFYSAGVEWNEIRPGFDVELYALEQTVDGLVDRRALGGELRYRAGALDLTTLLDYDPSFATLNQALLSAIWQATETIAVTALVETGKRPFVAVRNSLTGQSVATIGQLRRDFTEGQLRTLALDRSADASRAALGVSMPLGDRFRVNADLVTRDVGATVASGGVAALPETGREWTVFATLVGASLVADGDLTQLGLREDRTRTFESTSLTVDLRFPFGESLRLNPRLTLSQRRWLSDGSDQQIIAPALRAYYRVARRLLFEVEGGVRFSDRELGPGSFDPLAPDGTEQLLGNYFNIGYRWEFGS